MHDINWIFSKMNSHLFSEHLCSICRNIIVPNCFRLQNPEICLTEGCPVCVFTSPIRQITFHEYD